MRNEVAPRLSVQTFRVVKEQNGWAVRLGAGMSTPFWTQALAIGEARRLCASLRAHGVVTEFVVEPEDLDVDAAPSRVAADQVHVRLSWR